MHGMDSGATDVEAVLNELESDTEAHVNCVAVVLRAQSAISDALSDHTDGASVDGTEHQKLPSASTPSSTKQDHQAAQPGSSKQVVDEESESLPDAAVSLSHKQITQKGVIAPPDAPESLTKSSKLLALKQRRLDSLSSSLDLSRESSFDASTQGREPHHSMQNSLAASLGAKLQPLQTPEADEQSSVSTAHLPLDSTTGNMSRVLPQMSWMHLTYGGFLIKMHSARCVQLLAQHTQLCCTPVTFA